MSVKFCGLDRLVILNQFYETYPYSSVYKRVHEANKRCCLKADTLFFFCCLVCSDIHITKYMHITARSLVCVHCFVWSVVFGSRNSRNSCLEFRFVSGFGHSRSIFCHCVSARSRGSLETAHSCPRVFCCVARSSCFYRLRAFMLYLVLCGTQLVHSLTACFHVVMSCVNTWLMIFTLAACSCPVLHMAGDLFAGHVLVFLFYVSTWLLS